MRQRPPAGAECAGGRPAGGIGRIDDPKIGERSSTSRAKSAGLVEKPFTLRT